MSRRRLATKKTTTKTTAKRTTKAAAKKPVAKKPTAKKASAKKPAKRKLSQLDAAGKVLQDASAVLGQRRTEGEKLVEQLAEFNGQYAARNGQAASRITGELANLKETFQSAHPQKLRTALHTIIESITLFWAPGGPRKWQLKRGITRLGER